MIRVPSIQEFMKENFVDPERPEHAERRACKRTFQRIEAGCAALLAKREKGLILSENEKIVLRKFDILDRYLKQPVD